MRLQLTTADDVRRFAMGVLIAVFVIGLFGPLNNIYAAPARQTVAATITVPEGTLVHWDLNGSSYPVVGSNDGHNNVVYINDQLAPLDASGTLIPEKAKGWPYFRALFFMQGGEYMVTFYVGEGTLWSSYVDPNQPVPPPAPPTEEHPGYHKCDGTDPWDRQFFNWLSGGVTWCPNQ